MSRRKKGFSEKGVCESQKVLLKSFSSNKSQLVLDSLHSSNKPGFIGFITNRGIDDKLLKGGFRKI